MVWDLLEVTFGFAEHGGEDDPEGDASKDPIPRWFSVLLFSVSL
jgi:hypothetical protein